MCIEESLSDDSRRPWAFVGRERGKSIGGGRDDMRVFWAFATYIDSW